MIEAPIVFIGGLYRSGTSLLHRYLLQHPQISGFAGTGVPEDEGQYLQRVYPTARDLGGPGHFGFADGGRLTESSNLVQEDSAERIWRQWSRHWDLSQPVLLEKSLPNLIRSRFLQALFPASRHIMMVRHPIVVAGATREWSRSSFTSLLEHWLRCHGWLAEDLPHVRRFLVLRYEDFVSAPDRWLPRIFAFLNLPSCENRLGSLGQKNDSYFQDWERERRGLAGWLDARRAAQRLEERVEAFGYSLQEPERLTAPGGLPLAR